LFRSFAAREPTDLARAIVIDHRGHVAQRADRERRFASTVGASFFPNPNALSLLTEASGFSLAVPTTFRSFMASHRAVDQWRTRGSVCFVNMLILR
jgi:hypothetical protein